jgi:PTH1 family peptidyl-tRNA hydrolase
MKCIIGLGNFPKEYQNTRHNFGFLAVDFLAKKFNFLEFKFEKKFYGSISCGEILNEKVFLLKPETFMNNSGKAVSALLSFYKITAEDLFVLHDDLDLPFKKIRFKKGGSGGGNNGIRSIISSLGTEEFARLKFGISNPQREIIPAERFVLQRFSDEESSKIPLILKQGVERLLSHF